MLAMWMKTLYNDWLCDRKRWSKSSIHSDWLLKGWDWSLTYFGLPVLLHKKASICSQFVGQWHDGWIFLFLWTLTQNTQTTKFDQYSEFLKSWPKQKKERNKAGWNNWKVAKGVALDRKCWPGSMEAYAPTGVMRHDDDDNDQTSLINNNYHNA